MPNDFTSPRGQGDAVFGANSARGRNLAGSDEPVDPESGHPLHVRTPAQPPSSEPDGDGDGECGDWATTSQGEVQ